MSIIIIKNFTKSHFIFEHILEATIEGFLTLCSIFDLEQIYLLMLSRGDSGNTINRKAETFTIPESTKIRDQKNCDIIHSKKKCCDIRM